jgi:hypothetical protein
MSRGGVPWWVDLPPTKSAVALQPRGEGDPKTEHCVVCGKAILQMIFKGSGVCGELHRKFRDDIKTGDTGVNGWYHTCAKNLRNHHGHQVRFSLPDPWTIYEGTICHVNFGEDDAIIGIVLEPGYTTISAADARMEREPSTHGEEQYATELAPYKVVEVRRCK